MSLTFRWRLYWATLATAIFGVSYLTNRQRYAAKSKTWVLGKSIADTLLAGGLAWACPPLLIGLVIMQIMRHSSDHPAVKLVGNMLLWTGLTALGGWFLEGLLVLGVIATNQVSGVFLERFRLRSNRVAADNIPTLQKAA